MSPEMLPEMLYFVDAREVLVIDKGEMGPVVAWDASRPRLNALLPTGFNGIAVITGFVGSDRDGLPTTLGRNGSDYSASIFGALLDATEVHIWTDVDGVLSGRPAARAGSEDHRRDVVQRGHGARVLRRQGDPPADDGAGDWPRHPDLDPQHVQRRRIRARKISRIDVASRLAASRASRHRQHRAREPRGRRHDRRAGHRAIGCSARCARRASR